MLSIHVCHSFLLLSAFCYGAIFRCMLYCVAPTTEAEIPFGMGVGRRLNPESLTD